MGPDARTLTKHSIIVKQPPRLRRQRSWTRVRVRVKSKLPGSVPVVTVPVEKGSSAANCVSSWHSRQNTSGGGHSRRVSSSAALRDLEMQGLLMENGEAFERDQDTPKVKSKDDKREHSCEGGVCSVM